MGSLLLTASFSLRPVIRAFFLAVGLSPIIVGCASTSFDDAPTDTQALGQENNRIAAQKKDAEFLKIKDVSVRIEQRKQFMSSTTCEEECKYLMMIRLPSEYNQLKRFGEARAAYWDALQLCKTRKESTSTCDIYQSGFDLSTAQLVPQNDEALRVLKEVFNKNPSPSIGESYLVALRHKGLTVEADKEDAYLKKIAIPLEEMQAKILSSEDSTANSDDRVARAVDRAEKYQILTDLYQSALEATSKSGLTQHDNYLQKTAKDYATNKARSLETADYYKKKKEEDAAAAQKKALEPKEESDTFGAVMGALFSGLAMGSTSSNGPALAAIGSALSGSSGSRTPTTSALTSNALSSLPSNASTKQILGTVFAAVMAETAARSEDKASSLQSAALTPSTTSSPSSGGSGSSADSGTSAGSGSVDGIGRAYSGTGCPTNLSHLDSKLPKYNSPTLQQIRQTVLTEDIRAAYQKALRMGHTPAQAASLSLQQAREYERSREESKVCIKQASTSPAAIIAQLENGTYNMSMGARGIVQACAENYVLMYYGAVANKEIAAAFACMAQK